MAGYIFIAFYSNIKHVNLSLHAHTQATTRRTTHTHARADARADAPSPSLCVAGLTEVEK